MVVVMVKDQNLKCLLMLGILFLNGGTQKIKKQILKSAACLKV